MIINLFYRMLAAGVILLLVLGRAGAVEDYSAAKLRRMIVTEAESQGLNPALALALAKVGSDFQVRTVGTLGVVGIMQIPSRLAASEYGVDDAELRKPSVNIRLGVDYMLKLVRRYPDQLSVALAHYYKGVPVTATRLTKVGSAARDFVDQVLDWRERYLEQSATWGNAAAGEAASNDSAYDDYDDYDYDSSEVVRMRFLDYPPPPRPWRDPPPPPPRCRDWRWRWCR